jgi:phosphatidylglycerophosphate synthase
MGDPAATYVSGIERRPMKIRERSFFTSNATALARAGVTPNAISIMGLVVGIAGGLVLASTVWPESDTVRRVLWLAAAVVVPLRGVFNILDGVVAVNENFASPVGELYNEVPDRVSDIAILIGAGYAVGGGAVLGVGAALLAVFVAYVRVQARVAGATQDYCGPMAKPGRIFLIALTALWLGITPASLQLAWGPDGSWGLMAAALVAIMVGCVITAARRLLRAGRFLRVSTP